MESNSPQRNLNPRLNSWKEIASFFDRDERTVKRWEKRRGLPVHRMPGGERGGVFAYTEELTAWLKSAPPNDLADAGRLGNSLQTASANAKGLGIPLDESGAVFPTKPFPPPVVERKRRPKTWLIWGAAGIVMVASITWVLKRQLRQAAQPSAADSRSSSRTPSAEAEDLYLKGRFYWNKRTPDDLNKAVDYFTQAIVRDPDYARAYVGLADSYNLLREFSAMPSSEAFPRALAAARKAVELDDYSAEAHTSLAFALLYANLDEAGAEREFKRAIALDPNNGQAHHWYATALLAFGRFPESLKEIEIAQKLDPASKAILADKGVILFSAGQPDAAVTLLKQIETSDPSFVSPHRYLSMIAYQHKDYPDYFAEWKETAISTQDEKDLSVEKAAESGFVAGGFHGMVESMLPIQKKLYLEGSLGAYPLAHTYALLGRNREALQFLQDAYNQRDMGLLSVPGDSAFNDLHEDPVYKDLMAQAAISPRN
jgi:tetratricopeptide (TPR) repeat protein